MDSSHYFPAIFLLLLSSSPLILSQQPYIRQAITACSVVNDSSSSLGYACNGVNRSCQAYLTFTATPPYESVFAISSLLNVNSAELSRLNSVRENTIFERNEVVLIPINCSCSGKYYQANTSYTFQKNDILFSIANNTFQGLSTCQALRAQSLIDPRDLQPGDRIPVPLRCACPTKNQTDGGVRYLLSYLVAPGDFVSRIGGRFGAGTGKTLAANGLSLQDSTIYPFTTLLIPLQNPPTAAQVTSSPPRPPSPPSVSSTLPSPPVSGGSSRSWVYALVGAISGFALASVIGIVIFCIFFSKRKHKSHGGASSSSESLNSLEKQLKKMKKQDSDQGLLKNLSNLAQSLKVYSFQDLKAATQDFSPNRLIKGSVYHGTINGDSAAIKKMNRDVSKEITLLNKINHFNLIRLSGICLNSENWYLVYEYASNGPLSDWIHHHHGRTESLTWNQRLQIALDISTGLNYLHNFTSPAHVHKDLTSSNVLLDRDFRAKIANFGMARSAEGPDGQVVLTRHILGTRGYMAPEYLENGIVSTKLDVYAFGILMLEILTGKDVTFLSEDGKVKPEASNENVKELVDPLLQGDYPKEAAVLLFQLITDCIKDDPSDRPNTDDIFRSLSRISNSLDSGEWVISNSEHPNSA